MKDLKRRRRLLTTTVLAGALAVLAAPVVLLAPDVAIAQDYTSGTLSGRVQGTDGAAVAGAAVTIRSTSQGVTRTTASGPDGEFRFALIPAGEYVLTVTANGFESQSDEVSVSVSGTSSYNFTIASTSDVASVDDVIVTGARRRVAFTETTTGATLDVEELVEQIPIARNVAAVALLAPGAVAGDSAFTVATSQLQTPPSLSGASVAENAYFVNGLNTTNFVNGLGGAGVPFDFYKTVEVKTGGYSAEFGRATGGIINAVTKSGTNDFVVELHGTWAPDSLREDTPNDVYFQNSLGEFEEKTLTLEMGGPILRDRLFAYGIVSYQDTQLASGLTSGAYRVDEYSSDPFVGLKLDGYITSDHRVELTYFDTARERLRTNYAFDPATNAIGTEVRSTETLQQGGENFVARYTGNITDWLTLSAAYGESDSDLAAVNSLSGESRVIDYRTVSTGRTVSRQTTSGTVSPFETTRKFYRADADMYVSFMGEHHIRAGFDHEQTTLTETSTPNGGMLYELRRAGATNTLGLAAGEEYISTRRFISGGGFEGENKAIYIQDSWDVNDRLNLQLGWRQDKFQVSDPNGTPFVSFQDEQALRLGFAFDPTGEATSRFYGSYGRYYLPPASNTAYRMAAPAIDFNEFYRGAGPGGAIGPLDPITGLPTAGRGPQITAATGATALQPCPDGVGSNAAPGTVACSIRDDGTSTPPEALSARNLASTFEDEFRFGYEHQVNDLWTVGVGATYRKLGRVVEDALLDAGVLAYCAREGIAMTTAAGDGCADIFTGQSYYLLINPGSDVVVTLPEVLAGDTEVRTITLSAEDLGLPKARREYAALEFTVERAFDGVWGLQGSYVLSKSEGNYEGSVKSDTGQTDAGIVSDFDFLAFIPGQYGLLPNHRGHQFKLFGSYQVTQDLLVGANLSVTSPRAYGCLGNAPANYLDGGVANDSYGPLSRFCRGMVVDRGSVFETDWVDRLDLSFRYTVPQSLIPGGVVLRADIFNVFNRQNVTEAYEYGEQEGGAPDPQYRDPVSYQEGRSVRIGFDIAF